MGAVASCMEDEVCGGGLIGLLGGASGKSPGLTTTRIRTVNQMNSAIRRGQAPGGIKRVDTGKVKGEQDNVHFDDGAALNRDGSWKHATRKLTRSEREFLEQSGFKVPK